MKTLTTPQQEAMAQAVHQFFEVADLASPQKTIHTLLNAFVVERPSPYIPSIVGTTHLQDTLYEAQRINAFLAELYEIYKNS